MAKKKRLIRMSDKQAATKWLLNIAIATAIFALATVAMASNNKVFCTSFCIPDTQINRINSRVPNTGIDSSMEFKLLKRYKVDGFGANTAQAFAAMAKKCQDSSKMLLVFRDARLLPANVDACK